MTLAPSTLPMQYMENLIQLAQQEQTDAGQLALNGDAEAAMVKVEDSGTIETRDQANAEPVELQALPKIQTEEATMDPKVVARNQVLCAAVPVDGVLEFKVEKVEKKA